MRSRAIAALFTALVTAYAWLLLRAESQGAIAALILVGIAAGILAMRTQLLRPVARSLGSNERFAQGLAFAAVVVIALALRDDDFALLLLTRVLIVIVACLGLNVQFGYTGVVNFAGASFFGVVGCRVRELRHLSRLPPILAFASGGATAALYTHDALSPPLLICRVY